MTDQTDGLHERLAKLEEAVAHLSKKAGAKRKHPLPALNELHEHLLRIEEELKGKVKGFGKR